MDSIRELDVCLPRLRKRSRRKPKQELRLTKPNIRFVKRVNVRHTELRSKKTCPAISPLVIAHTEHPSKSKYFLHYIKFKTGIISRGRKVNVLSTKSRTGKVYQYIRAKFDQPYALYEADEMSGKQCEPVVP